MNSGTKQPAAVAENAPAAPYELALVIPTFCEAGNIGVLLDRARAVLDTQALRYQIIVVDDDSCDGTPGVVMEIARQDPRISLVVRKGERGLSGAILDGWRHANAEILGVMDADLQHPPELLAPLLAAMRAGNDMAIGSRYTSGGELGEWHLSRKLISAAAVGLTRPIQHRGCYAHDPMSGFFLVRRCCIDQIAFQRAGFKLLLEVLVRGRIASVAEVPFVFGRRFKGSSKASLRVAWDYLRLLVRLYAWRFRPGSMRKLAAGARGTC